MRKINPTLSYVLESLIPFTEANMNLAFRPHAFFNELDRRGKISSHSARNAYYRAKSNGLIIFDGKELVLSARAWHIIGKHTPATLPPDQCLMVIFDIPEEYRQKRRQLRSLLRELRFRQEQRSVWTSANDHREIVLRLINELQITQYTKVFLGQKLD